MSAMAREDVDTPIMLRKLGFEGDQVGDPTVHGGVDKALHFYQAEHYPFWRKEFTKRGWGAHPLLDAYGAFGENITAGGLPEAEVCIGDRFRLGEALVEVSQGRQPCWKIDHHFGLKGLTAAFITTGRCGLYFRVIEEGMVAPGDDIEQVAQGAEEWTVERVFRILIGGAHKGEGVESLRALVALPTLAENWRARAAKLAATI